MRSYEFQYLYSSADNRSNQNVTSILLIADRAGEKDVDEAHTAGAYRTGSAKGSCRQR